jgi:hypothetical protein
MPATPLTIQCRAVAARMRVFPNCEGNAVYVHRLVYEDSATIASLIPELEAIVPPVPYGDVQGLYRAASFAGTAMECGGNTGLWPLMAAGADALIVAVDHVEANAAGVGQQPGVDPQR